MSIKPKTIGGLSSRITLLGDIDADLKRASLREHWRSFYGLYRHVSKANHPAVTNNLLEALMVCCPPSSPEGQWLRHLRWRCNNSDILASKMDPKMRLTMFKFDGWCCVSRRNVRRIPRRDIRLPLP